MLNIIKAISKQIPKKVEKIIIDEQEESGYQETCPVCGAFTFGDYCSNCGQKLDWK